MVPQSSWLSLLCYVPKIAFKTHGGSIWRYFKAPGDLKRSQFVSEHMTNEVPTLRVNPVLLRAKNDVTDKLIRTEWST